VGLAEEAPLPVRLSHLPEAAALREIRSISTLSAGWRQCRSLWVLREWALLARLAAQAATLLLAATQPSKAAAVAGPDRQSVDSQTRVARVDQFPGRQPQA
jgi:hypothetical protein